MRDFIYVLSFLLFGTSAFAQTSLSIEDDALFGPIPKRVAEKILQRKDYESAEEVKCKFVGIPVNLSNDKNKKDWIVTTAQGCLWAAFAGPIWVVMLDDGDYKVVLHTVDISLTVGTQLQNGSKHIATSSGTAGWYEEKLWKFNGVVYNITKSRSVDLSNPVSCRKNRDVCNNK